MDPLQKPQICPLRVPNEREQLRMERSNRWALVICAPIPLVLLIPVFTTPQDPEVPKFIVMTIAMELGLWLILRFKSWAHAGSGIYFDARCCGCATRLSFCLGSARYGLDRKGAFRCRCKAVNVYETVRDGQVQVGPPPRDSRWFSSVGTLLPRAWPAD